MNVDPGPAPGFLLLHDPAVCVGPRRHRRADLKLAGLAADPAPHADRQPALAVTRRHEFGERQHRPPVARRAVCGELMVVLVQAADGAEVDHDS
jgi:hypothetical protein